MAQTALTFKICSREIDELTDTSPQEALKKGRTFHKPVESDRANILLRRVQATLGGSFDTNEKRKAYQRKDWNIAAKHHGTATPFNVASNGNDIVTVAAFAGDLSDKN